MYEAILIWLSPVPHCHAPTSTLSYTSSQCLSDHSLGGLCTHPVVLIGCYCHELSLREDERLEILLRIALTVWTWIYHYHMEARLVPVHRVQDDLFGQEERHLRWRADIPLTIDKPFIHPRALNCALPPPLKCAQLVSGPWLGLNNAEAQSSQKSEETPINTLTNTSYMCFKYYITMKKINITKDNKTIFTAFK